MWGSIKALENHNSVLSFQVGEDDASRGRKAQIEGTENASG